MTRVFDDHLRCSICQRPGPNGWIYQCSQDFEDMIEHAVCRGEIVSYDALGHVLTPQLDIRRGSPAAREDRLSFFDEVSQEQMARYRPDQIATIIRQRENVQATIRLERLRSDSTEIISSGGYPNVLEAANFAQRKPWVCSIKQECRCRACSRCRPGAADRAFLSLNAVANGEIPPTAAVGFGFHTLGERPVVDADIVKNLGRRTAAGVTADESSPGSHTGVTTPAKPVLPPRDLSSQDSLETRQSIQPLFEGAGRVPPTADVDFTCDDNNSSQRSREQAPNMNKLGSLKPSPRCRNLGKMAQSSEPPLPRLRQIPASYVAKGCGGSLEESDPGADNRGEIDTSPYPQSASTPESTPAPDPSLRKTDQGVAVLEDVPDIAHA